MKRKIVMLCLILSVFILGGCGAKNQSTINSNTEEKMTENVVVKTGILKTKVGDEWLLQTDSEIINVTSNRYNLDDYMEKKIEVTGMYSGSTLYVDELVITN
ncbi:hypothetical protein KKE45_02480 [Patescibacteria group bacterium]|nr:hypothetical protein [Patescibacteria group bacterium]